jgi:hypothetical protein
MIVLVFIPSWDCFISLSPTENYLSVNAVLSSSADIYLLGIATLQRHGFFPFPPEGWLVSLL